ncbi:DUF2938 domain-containing protein [Chitiniphilus purpureus]|uniref:DUF2938 domain-containing protein n=1 Tax=Chitiniphilus purpureus TaxID=2981137 RepID=A0ABY6DQ06_9NEIS|nr:DUF2938 domain-containing protein [Chitiniphilus sp. CD1]UXY13993.1 DUF2938 domain-containing protein [Chitiniphilus sp. CD1]
MMQTLSSNAAYALLLGIGATLLMDLWSYVRQRLLGVRPLDYGLVGRWLAYLPRGRWSHSPIAATPAVRGERALGWVVHYAIGIAFGVLLLSIVGPDWRHRPTLLPALGVGLGTVVAPFLILQPVLGSGLAACRTPDPGWARLHTLLTHGIFGLGLYGSAAFLAWIR